MRWQDRLQRPQGHNEPGHAHELTFSCFRQNAFLSKDRTCKWLANAIGEAKTALNYSLWAYMFMPDHVHLVVFPRDRSYDDSEFLRRIKEPVSRKAVQFLKRESPQWLPRIRVRRGSRVEHHFWQPGRGHDRNIDNTTTLQKMIDYIHLNPVRKGFVEETRQWKWSSAGWFEGTPLNGLQPDPIPWDWLDGIW